MSEPNRINATQAAQRIESASRIVLTTHARADGDAVGSLIGLGRVLRRLGKQVRSFLHEEFPRDYRFLLDNDTMEVWSAEAASNVLSACDLLLVVDTCAARQLDKIEPAVRTAAVAKLAIDHHVTRDDIVDAILVDEQAASCTQLIAGLCDSAGWPLCPRSATALFVGLMTDTGWLRFSNVDGAALRTAARLIDAGAKPNELYERLYLNASVARTRLAGRVLSGFELTADGALAIIRLRREDFEACGASHDMTEDLINEPQRVGSVNVSIMFVEPPTAGSIRVSFRSKRHVDVAGIARLFGGGGHERAAGARIEGSLDDVADKVIAAVHEAMERP